MSPLWNVIHAVHEVILLVYDIPAEYVILAVYVTLTSIEVCHSSTVEYAILAVNVVNPYVSSLT